MKLDAYHLKSVMVLLGAITLFACEGNYKNVQKLSLKDGAPIGIGEGVRFVYTDSGKVVSEMMTDTYLDFTNLDFSYQEFPDGVEVHFYDSGQENTVTSKYAIRFDETELVDLRDSVVLTTADGNILQAEQLYWDQKNQWVFTNEPYRITFSDGSYNDGADGFDANEDFTVFLSRRNDGVQIINPEQKNDNGQ